MHRFTLTVPTERPYKVTIEEGFKEFSLDFKPVRTLIVTDETVASLYLERVKGLFKGKVFSLILPVGEQNKNLETCFTIVDFLLDNDFTRNDLVVSLGGGVVGDTAAFAASIFKRGIKLYHLPTTLIAMTDSALGGKTGVNYGGVKNLVGTFYQPCGVYANTEFLATLPDEHIKSGLAEMVKYAFISGDETILNCIDKDSVYKCLSIKSQMIHGDIYDFNKRRLLNLGHTVGHALEALYDFKVSHGECVFKGIYRMISISQKLYGFDDEKKQRLYSYLARLNIDANAPFTKKSIYEKIVSDKKREGNILTIAAIYNFGDIRLEKLSLTEFKKLL